MQWLKKKWQKDKQWWQNTAQKTKDQSTNTNHTKTRGGLRCSGRVSSLCSTCGTRHVTLVTNPVTSHGWGKNGIVITTNRTYSWSFVMVTTVKLSKCWLQLNQWWTLAQWFFFLVTTVNQGNRDMNRKLRNIFLNVWYAGTTAMLLYINGKFTIGKLKVSFLNILDLCKLCSYIIIS